MNRLQLIVITKQLAAACLQVRPDARSEIKNVITGALPVGRREDTY